MIIQSARVRRRVVAAAGPQHRRDVGQRPVVARAPAGRVWEARHVVAVAARAAAAARRLLVRRQHHLNAVGERDERDAIVLVDGDGTRVLVGRGRLGRRVAEARVRAVALEGHDNQHDEQQPEHAA